MTSRLDYLSGLGITCIWLMPFYPTAHRDDGYDVTDYGNVDPRFGTMADFAEFVLETRERGIHVIIDLVPNHSSDQHPWFQSARSSPDSPYRDYYVWRTDDPGDTSDQVVFPGEQDGIWTWDEQAQAYYLHHFLATQPDLNFANPAVREEFRRYHRAVAPTRRGRVPARRRSLPDQPDRGCGPMGDGRGPRFPA